MAVITISREFASGGDDVASQLCTILGYRSFGKDEILQAAKQTTMSKTNAIDYHEDNHEVQNNLERFFNRGPSIVQKIAWNENHAIASRPERADVQESAVLSLVKQAILSAARSGNRVIIGRAGQVLLKDFPGVLHVRIEAPQEMRIERVKQQLKKDPEAPKSDDKLTKEAAELIETRDKASADYIRQYFNVDWRNPQLYHLVLNLGMLEVEQAVKIVITAVQALEMQAQAPGNLDQDAA